MLKDLADRLLSAAKALYDREPARINAAIATGVVAVLAFIGVGVDVNSALAIVVLVVPLVLGELTRAKVVPHVTDVTGHDGDDAKAKP